MEPIISVRGLGKSYRIQSGERKPYRTLRDDLVDFGKGLLKGQWGRSRTEEFWALKDVNFDIYPGEVVGIIGRNGAGKSTLLKILSRVIQPSTGEAILRGKVASLLEVGTGFHPELTGRENIFMNGAVLGMNHSEIRRKFAEIVEFAEIGKFLDTPVKRYSSGMYVRLAFSVAAHLEPEILFVDEVLAVGDAKFQEKCLGKMGEVAKHGKTVLFVSHNTSAIQSLCSSAMLFTAGNLTYRGTPESTISKYLDWKNSWKLVKENLQKDVPVTLVDFKTQKNNGVESVSFTNGEEIRIEWEILLNQPIAISFCLVVEREGILVSCINTYHQNHMFENLNPGRYVIRTKIPKYILNPGQHLLGLNISDQTGENLYLEEKNMLALAIQDDQVRRGAFYRAPWPGSFCLLPDIELKSYS
jgi:lipopolysaccharide transport system ATP-binding protein